MGEEAERDEDDKTMAVSRGLEKFEPSVTFELFLEDKSLADFTIFDLDELRIDVSSSMTFAQDLQRLLVLSFCDEEAGGFRNKPAMGQLACLTKGPM